MKMAELLTIMRNKLDALRRQRADAASVGDLERVVALDVEITETEETVRDLGG